jgi:hypothetical protein
MDQEQCEHRLSAVVHCNGRIRERLNRKPDTRAVDKMRLALLNNNSDCFTRQVSADSIVGIVRYQNIWTRAVLDTRLGVVVTVGV